ncbi:serine hydrolase [Steroidobacter sp.]|uniref:serine hydrolase n=1 Tax=Steroidobacter sp. TaxID=1978227 RepID=UPI001A59BE36|nr:serine hydrolase [Steroidobacter sp.]MBL8267998.1 serine hydrolase [Steroidobacter sp.]
MAAVQRRYSVSLLLILAVVAGSVSAQSLTGLDRFIATEMAKEKAPGLALVVVKDGKLIHQRGYGYRDVERKLPVTPETLFAIGSVSKSFTVLTLGALAQQGELAWDRPVKSYLPDFQLFDPFATEHMTPRDLVTHRSGLPRHDGLWYGSSLKRADYYQRLRYLEPSAEFRTRYQYNNLMFVTAGYLSERISGTSWEKLLQQRIFLPLAMTRSYSDIAAFQQDREPALPYVTSDKAGTIKVDYANIDAIAPAGAINSTALDMSRYLRALMEGGRFEGKQVLDADTVREMQTPQMIIADTPRYPELGRGQYGMGLSLATYRGHNVVSHGGNIDGFTAYLGWLPQERVGLVLLINQGSSQLRSIVSQRVFDQMLGLKPIDWSSRYAADKALRKSADAPKDRPEVGLRKLGTAPGHALEEYVGRFEHPAYGAIEIGRDQRGLTLGYHQKRIALEHFHYDVFAAPEDDVNPLAETKVQFNTGIDGEVSSVAIVMEPAIDAIVFNRRGGEEMRELSFLQKFVGTYQLGTDTARISLQDGSLVLGYNDLPLRRLLPLHGTRFGLEGRQDHSIEFIAKDQLAYRRPGGASVGSRAVGAE